MTEETIKLTPISAMDADFQTALAIDNLPIADLATSRGHYFSAHRGEKLVGYGGYESLGRAILLRSIVVTGARGSGTGNAIATLTLEDAKNSGGEMAFLFTENADQFFAHLGFEILARDKTPTAVRSHPQFDRLCTDAAIVMQRRL